MEALVEAAQPRFQRPLGITSNFELIHGNLNLDIVEASLQTMRLKFGVDARRETKQHTLEGIFQVADQNTIMGFLLAAWAHLIRTEKQIGSQVLSITPVDFINRVNEILVEADFYGRLHEGKIEYFDVKNPLVHQLGPQTATAGMAKLDELIGWGNELLQKAPEQPRPTDNAKTRAYHSKISWWMTHENGVNNFCGAFISSQARGINPDLEELIPLRSKELFRRSIYGLQNNRNFSTKPALVAQVKKYVQNLIEVMLSAIERSITSEEIESMPREYTYPREESVSEEASPLNSAHESPPVTTMKPNTVLIFVALKEELAVLEKRWRLNNTYGSNFWTGQVGQANVLVYSPNKMGRVPAAIKTMQVLHELTPETPDMFFVLGIAGGFEEAKVGLGDVLIATNVVDLATRKMKEDDLHFHPEFRPTSYDIDERLQTFIESGDFDQKMWEFKVVQDLDWPDGRRPVIHTGSIVSLDDVVASDEWRKKLLSAWPKLIGIEMEAGGVLAAAKTFGLKGAVVRAVSDMADPAKADTAWRKQGMSTAAHLLETIFDTFKFQTERGNSFTNPR